VLALRRTRNVHSIPELFRALQRSDALGKVLAETRPIRQRDRHGKESNGLMWKAALCACKDFE